MATSDATDPVSRGSDLLDERSAELRPLAGTAAQAPSEAQAAESELSYSELLRRCWKLMAASMLLHMHGDIDQRILTPYFYTRIACCEPGAARLPEVMQFSGRALNLSVTAATCHCDVVATYGAEAVGDDGTIAACDVPQISRDSPLWSHSARCSNWPYVREETQVLITAWGSVAALVSFVVLPAAGNLADLYGRLQIFIWSSAIVGIGFLIFTVDAAFQLPDGVIVMTGVIFGCSRAHGPAAWAMLMDIVPSHSRVKWFPVMSAIAVTAPLLGEAISYPFLALHLTNYTALWAGLCMLGLLVVLFNTFVLEETLPQAQAKQWSGWAELFKDSSPLGYHRALRLWCYPHASQQTHNQALAVAAGKCEAQQLEQEEDAGDGPCTSRVEPEEELLRRARVLRVILVSSLLSAFGSGVFTLSNNVLLGALHYKQEQLVFLGVFSKLIAVPSGLLAALLLPTIGCYCAWVGGSLLTVVGFGCFTTLGYYGPYVCMFIWTVAFSFIKPAIMVYLSFGLRKEDQAKGIAILAVLDLLPAAFAPPIFTAVFFDPNSDQTTAFVLAGGVFLLSSMIVGFGLPRDMEAARLGSEKSLHAAPNIATSSVVQGETEEDARRTRAHLATSMMPASNTGGRNILP